MFSKYAYYHYLPTTASGLKRLGWGNSLQQIPKEKRFFVREGVEWQKPPVLRVFLSKYDMKQILLHFVQLNLLLFRLFLWTLSSHKYNEQYRKYFPELPQSRAQGRLASCQRYLAIVMYNYMYAWLFNLILE